MRKSALAPTSHAEINAVLRELLTGAQAVLGVRFVGMLLYGSLASGDFDPHTSDIDFVIVTDGELPEQTVRELETLHARLAAGGLEWAARLEGSYIPRAALRRFDPAAAPCPQINEGRFFVSGHGTDWIIQRHILREHGVVLAGPPADSLIDPVTPAELRRAVLGIFHEWWEPMLADPAWLERDDYRAFAVLSMCRILYTLQTGTIASKPVSARWAQQAFARSHAALIEKALAWKHDDPFDLLEPTLGLMRLTGDACRQFEETGRLAVPTASSGAQPD
jgi:hypothetical protein